MHLSTKQGYSTNPDPHEAVQELKVQIDQADIACVIAFCSGQYDSPTISRELREVFACPILGCATAGEIGPSGFQSRGITALSLAGEFELYTESFPLDISGPALDERLSDFMKRVGEPTGREFALLTIDGLSRAEDRITGQLYLALGGIPLVGGSAGDDLNRGAAPVFVDSELTSGYASVSVIRTDARFRTIHFNHFEARDQYWVVTGNDGMYLTELNGRPAAEVYAESIGLHLDELTPDVFTHNPLVLPIGGKLYIRSIFGVGENNSLQMLSDVEVGTVICFGRSMNPVERSMEAFAQLEREMGYVASIIGFDCLFRRGQFEGDNVIDVIDQIYRRNRVLGFSTFGEQYNSMHINQTFTGIALGA